MLSIQLLDTWTIYSICIDNIHYEQMVHRIIYIPLNFNLIKLMLLILKQPFLGLNLSIHNNIVSTKIYDNKNLILLIFRSLMAMSLDVPLMVYIYLKLFALPEHLRMLLTSIIVTKEMRLYPIKLNAEVSAVLCSE